MQTREKLPLAEVLRIGRETAEGLAAAHERGLIHRDIKPANMWLEGKRGRVKILDFGLARAADEQSHLTQQGAIVGTPAYMAPEQARGEARGRPLRPVQPRRACSTGCAAGELPFKGKDTLSTLMEVAMHEPPSPAQIDAGMPPALSELVMRLLEKDPARRPASAAEVVQTLQALEANLAREKDSQGDTLEVSAAPKRGVAPRRSRRTPLIAAAVLLLAGLIGLGAFTLIRISSDQGDYVIETDDPDFSFQVNKGAVTLEDRKTKRKYNLKVVKADRAAACMKSRWSMQTPDWRSRRRRSRSSAARRRR